MPISTLYHSWNQRLRQLRPSERIWRSQNPSTIYRNCSRALKNTIKIGENGIVQHLLYARCPSWHYAPRL